MKEKRIYYYRISEQDFMDENYDLDGHELQYDYTTMTDLGAIHERDNETSGVPRVPVKAKEFEDGRVLWITVFPYSKSHWERRPLVDYEIEMPEGWTPEEREEK